MKDKKFVILCILGVIWAAIFFGIIAGVRFVNPRLEELISFLLLGWFFYWTISIIRNKPSTTETNAPEKEKSKSE